MDIFILRLPAQASQREFRTRLQATMAKFSIETYSVEKRQGKTFGKLSILDTQAAQGFLDYYGVPRDSPPFVQPRHAFVWNGATLRMWQDRHEISRHAVQALELEASQRAAERSRPSQARQYTSHSTSTFNATSLKCGLRDFAGTQLAFTPFYINAKPATVIFGTQKAVCVLHGPGNSEQRVYSQYHDIEDIVLGSHQDPTITLKLRIAPKMYRVSDDDNLAAAMSAMSLGIYGIWRRRKEVQTYKSRSPTL